MPDTYAVAAMTCYAAAAVACKWDLTKGHLLPAIGNTGSLEDVDLSTLLNQLNTRLRTAARRAELEKR